MLMTTHRSDLLRQRLKPLGIELTRTTGTQYMNSCWLLEKPEPNLRQPWHMAARNLDDVEEIALRLEQRAARTSSAHTTTFGIPRPWEPATVAIITASTTALLSAYGIVRAIASAVTAWATTTSGAEATAEHRKQGWGFNVGDLSQHLDDPALQDTLRNHGIVSLSIASVDGGSVEWDFDDPIVQFEEIPS